MYKVATAAILIQTRGVQSVFSLEKDDSCFIVPNYLCYCTASADGHLPSVVQNLANWD